MDGYSGRVRVDSAARSQRVGVSTGDRQTVWIDSTPAPAVSNDPFEFRATLWLTHGKRIFDVLFALTFMAAIGWWLIPLIGLIIKLDSRGPVFYRQQRTGYQGKPFTCLKFRTMQYNPGAGFRQATRNDDRITRVGSILRVTNLDELPQFINVLRGDMSVVGPRPHVPELDAIFSEHVSCYEWRHCVRPGVTGLAQISGCRGETRSVREMRNRIRLDCFYIKNVGPFMDARIILRTMITMLRGDKSAY